MASPSHPNILLILGDEHPAPMTGCYGHRSVQSPHIDSLAARGLTFDAMYCSSPICAPSRASFMTSQHVHTIGVWDNAAPLNCDWPTFAHSFSAAGYRTILAGKMHFVGPDQLHGFDERWTQDVYPATMDWTRSNREAAAINDGGQTIRTVEAAGMGRSIDMEYDEEVIFRTEYGLRRIARQPEHPPFLLCASFTGPHFPFKAPEAYWNRYADEDIDLPDIPDDYLERENTYVKWLRRMGHQHEKVSDEICRKARRAILARITMIDDYIGRILALLKETGLDENTIVVYASDHGDMMGEHGLWYKNAAYDWSSRVPFIVSGPDIPHVRVAEVTSLLDLGPTLCGLAGVPQLFTRHAGRDLSGLIRGERAAGEGLAIMENYGEGVWRGWRMVRKGKYKLTYVPGHDPDLFDLEADPDEWQNLAQDPAYADIRAELEAIALDDWDPDVCDEARWQSEERRLAILKAGQQLDWQKTSPPVPHPRWHPEPAKLSHLA